MAAINDWFPMSRTEQPMDLYLTSLELVGHADELVERIPRPFGHLARDLREAAWSVARHVAEGNGEFDTPTDGAPLVRAECAATECATLIHTCERLRLGSRTTIRAARESISLIIAELTRSTRGREIAGSGR